MEKAFSTAIPDLCTCGKQEGTALPVRRRFSFALFSIAPLLGGCGMAVLNPQGPVGNREATLLGISALLMCIVVLPVFFLTVLFAWRYRAGARGDHYSPSYSYSVRLDVLVWSVPAAIVICLVVLNWRSTLALNPYRPIPNRNASTLVVDVVSMDWKWLFIYPDQGIASINQVVFPAGTEVDFRITSDSVMNVFFIPQLGSQIYSMSGMMTQVHLIAKNPGTYRGQSSNFSGPGFPGMYFNAVATDEAGFAAWVKTARASPGVLNDKTYQLLAGPNAYVPVSFYGHVKPGMFDDILAAHGSAARAMPQEATE